jgi:hypothetical protein
VAESAHVQRFDCSERVNRRPDRGAEARACGLLRRYSAREGEVANVQSADTGKIGRRLNPC